MSMRPRITGTQFDLLLPHENNQTFPVLDAYVRFLWLKTRQMVALKPVWLTIVGVAEALHESKHMYRAEIEQVMRAVALRGIHQNVENASYR